jgi:hypothetical protein
MQEIAILRWCDACGREVERVEGDTYRVGFDGVTREVELCAMHAEEILDPLRTLVVEYGHPVTGDKASKPATPVKAPPPEIAGTSRKRYRCLDDGVIYTNGDSLGKHYVDDHSIRLADVYGQVCPVCGRECQTYAALGVHIGRGHQDVLGGMTTSETFLHIERQGDPHGVVEAARKRLAAAAGQETLAG